MISIMSSMSILACLIAHESVHFIRHEYLTPLMLAVVQCNPTMIGILLSLSRRTLLHRSRITGQTALHFLAQGNHPTLLAAILKYTALIKYLHICFISHVS